MSAIVAILALAALLIAIWSQVRPTPAILWVAVLLLSIAVLLPVATSLFGH